MDWPGLMRAGMGPRVAGGLGLRPEAFWRLSPVELRVMLGAEAGAAPLTRARLDQLAAAYPDKTEEQDDGRYRDATGPGCGIGGHAGRGGGNGDEL